MVLRVSDFSMFNVKLLNHRKAIEHICINDTQTLSSYAEKFLSIYRVLYIHSWTLIIHNNPTVIGNQGYWPNIFMSYNHKIAWPVLLHTDLDISYGDCAGTVRGIFSMLSIIPTNPHVREHQIGRSSHFVAGMRL
jgi:hypothetical protein